MKSKFHIGAMVFFLALTAGCRSRESASVIDLSPGEFSAQIKSKGDSALLVDVRTPEEFREGRIPGALLLDFQDPSFAAEVAKLPREKQIYVYCRSGRRSKASYPVFLDAGFLQVRNLADGIIGWREAGLPLTKD